MRQKHVIKRGTRYQFVCRVPQDLKNLFPSPVIYRTLHSDDEKTVRLLVGAEEYHTQKLFMQLRSGMLSKELEKRIVASYLSRGVDRIEGQAMGMGLDKQSESLSPVDVKINRMAEDLFFWDDLTTRVARDGGADPADIAEHKSKLLRAEISVGKRQLSEKSSSKEYSVVPAMAKKIQTELGVRLGEKDQKRLALRLTDADIQLAEAELASIGGDWSQLRALRSNVRNDLATPYFDFTVVLEKYQENFIASKPNVKPGTQSDMSVECRVLLEIIGNISITEVNTMDTVAKLKTALRKYPKNRQQRFGNKPLPVIIRAGKGYEVIALKTANEYIKRLKSVIDYAAKAKMLNASNVVNGELFRLDLAQDEQRSAYGPDDIKRLIDAICTQPLWSHNPDKPERFWVILIALFHGLRLGNIVSLTKANICQTDGGLWVFDLTHGKTKSTVRPVAICDSLLLLGFLEWVEKLDRERLFQDSTKSFSAWYNRDEVRKDGRTTQGFESKYVTTNKKKCLYSLRHTFAGNVFEVTEDFKITSDMLGHSTGGSVTARYTKRTKAETLKEVTDKMQLENIDIDMLETRAVELFIT